MSWNIGAFCFIRAAAIAAAVTAATSVGAFATTVDLSWSGANGYSAAGSFTYDGSSAPSIITESGSGATKSVQSFSITFFDPSHTVLESGSSVVSGVSSDSFFRLTFNTVTDVVSALDADIGGSYIYFLTDLRTPTGSVVPAGTTGFNFFDRRTADSALDTASGISAVVEAGQAVQEPPAFALAVTAVLALMAFKRRIG